MSPQPDSTNRNALPTGCSPLKSDRENDFQMMMQRTLSRKFQETTTSWTMSDYTRERKHLLVYENYHTSMSKLKEAYKIQSQY